MKVSYFFWNVRGLANQKTVEMLFNLLKQHKPLLVFIVGPMMSDIDALDSLFKKFNLHLVPNSPIINKVAKIWCLSISNLVQNSLVNS